MVGEIVVEKEDYAEVADYIILKVFPKLSVPGALGIGGSILVSNLGVAVTKKVPTYAITATGWLLINPDFFKEMRKRAEELYKRYTLSAVTSEEYFVIINYFLISHELGHIIYGHVNDPEIFKNPNYHKIMNISQDRWTNKFAAEILLKSIFSVKTSYSNMNSVLDDVVKMIARVTENNWNKVVELILGEGYVNDEYLTKIIENYVPKIPDFDELTSKEIAELLLSVQAAQSSSRTGFTLKDKKGSPGIPEQYPIDVLSDFTPDEDDYVARKPSKEFEDAKKDPKKLSDIWRKKLIEASRANANAGVGTAAGMFKEEIDIALRNPMINYKKIIISTIEKEFGINEFESPDVLDDMYELEKEADYLIDDRVMMYGTMHKSPSAIIISNDMSGSMGDKETFDILGSEIYHAASSKNIKGIIHVQWDTIIQHVAFTRRPEKKFTAYGLGGTDPVPFFKLLAKEKDESNEEHFDTFWKLFRKHRAAKFVVFISDFYFFDDSIREAARYIDILEKEGWKFIFVNTVIKKAVAPSSNAAKEFMKLAGESS